MIHGADTEGHDHVDPARRGTELDRNDGDSVHCNMIVIQIYKCKNISARKVFNKAYSVLKSQRGSDLGLARHFGEFVANSEQAT
jgi:hypothetical protein